MSTRIHRYILLTAFAGLVLLPATTLYSQDSSDTPELPSQTIIEYAEQKGGIVHISFSEGYRNNDAPSDIATLKNLITETVEKTTAKSSANPAVISKPVTKPTPAPPAVATKPNPETKTQTRKTQTTVVKRKPPVEKPKPVDYTIIPDPENRIKCPARTCGVWNNVMESVCRFCGETLKNSPQIQTAREELLNKQAEAQKRLEAERAMYASKPEPVEEKKEPEIKKPVGPAYKTFGLQISQLGTAYGSLAETKLMRDSIKALDDLSLALKAPDKNVQANVKKLLPKLVTEENASAFVQALRNPSKRPAGELALKGCGSIAAGALFTELEANNADSAASVVRAIGPLGQQAVDMVEERLTPEFVPLYPQLANTLISAGSPSLPMLCRILSDTEDEYILNFAGSTLTRFGEKAVPPMIIALQSEARWDRKKRFVEVLGDIGSSQAMTTLLEYVKTERHGIYLSARKALAQIGTLDSLKQLGALMGTGSTDLVEQTLSMLISSKGPVAKALESLAEDTNPRVRRFAVKGLGDILSSNPQVRPTIEAATKDSDRGVRKQAESILQ